MNNIEKLMQLKSIVGGHAFRALQNGRTLNIWRRTTPHNWFICNANGRSFLWHSFPDHPKPDLGMFEKISDSKDRILIYFGSDSGMPALSKYILKPCWRKNGEG